MARRQPRRVSAGDAARPASAPTATHEPQGRRDHGTADFLDDWTTTPEGQLYQALQTTTGWIDVAHRLHAPVDADRPGLGLAKSHIARGAGVRPSTVTKWFGP